MRKFYTYVAVALFAILLCSCSQDAMDPLTGKYPVPTTSSSSSLVNGGITEQDGLNLFRVCTDELDLTFVARNWYLPAGDYIVSDATASGSVLSFSTCKGRTVEDGAITVEKSGNNYSIRGVVTLQDGSIVKINASGILEYIEVILEPKHYYMVTPTDPGRYDFTLTDLQGTFAANFLLVTDSGIARSYEVVSDSETITDGQAFVGIDLSFLGLGPLGSYFDVDGVRWFIMSGTVDVSGDESMYTVEVKNMVAVNAASETYPASSILFENAVKEQPKPMVLEGWSFYHEESAGDGFSEHTLTLIDAGGFEAGRVLIDTYPLGGVIGTFEAASPSDEQSAKIGKYITGFDASAFGMGVLGSFITVDGTQAMISGGTMSISNNGGLYSISIEAPVLSGINVTSLTLENMTMTVKPDPKEDVVFEVKGGTYTYVTAPKSDAEGIIEHTFSFKDAEGNAVGQILIWSSDNTYTGVWPFLPAKGTPAPGNFVGGLELDLSAFGLGISNLGSYFIKDGKTYLLNAGTAIVAEEGGKLGVLISGVEAATGASAGSEASDVTVLSFSEMEAYVPPVVSDAFTVEGGTYTVSSEDKESVTEYTIQFSDSEGNLVAQTVLRTAKGAALESGTFTVAGADEQPGTYVFGLDFFGMMNIGTFYIKDGKTYYVTDGTLNFVDFFTIYGLTIENAVAADGEGNPGATSIAISGMIKAE